MVVFRSDTEPTEQSIMTMEWGTFSTFSKGDDPSFRVTIICGQWANTKNPLDFCIAFFLK